MPNQGRKFVIVHPELSERHEFTGHAPLQAANKAYTHLRKNHKAATKGKLVFIIREVNKTKELAYSGTCKKLQKPVVIVRKDGTTAKYKFENTVHRMEDAVALKVKRTTHTKKRNPKTTKNVKSATRRR